MAQATLSQLPSLSRSIDHDWIYQITCAFKSWVVPNWPIILTWTLIFFIVFYGTCGLGFGPAGVAAGSMAAAFQSYWYGGFTPAGGFFAILTSIAMLGFLVPVLAFFSVCIASLITFLLWYFSIVRPGPPFSC
ncbi:hypothetical protein BT69DRAFT_1257208 [Atractiella rhizophila]|nr:hypothetical protein BT69DRAFT_1257208 [Atractiella rhizophila]